MALLMRAAMAAVMLFFMWHMYPKGKLNVPIVVGSIAVFAGGTVAGAQPADRRRSVVEEGQDPAPFDRHPGQASARTSATRE
jgi:hypothetical protein